MRAPIPDGRSCRTACRIRTTRRRRPGGRLRSITGPVVVASKRSPGSSALRHNSRNKMKPLMKFELPGGGYRWRSRRGRAGMNHRSLEDKTQVHRSHLQHGVGTRPQRAARWSCRSAAPSSPVDQTKVPHYFGPYPNWANSPLTVPDANVTITGDGSGAQAQAQIGERRFDHGDHSDQTRVTVTRTRTSPSGDPERARRRARTSSRKGRVVSVAVNKPGAATRRRS